MSTYGDPDSAGAIFVFKGDNTEHDALAAAAEVARAHHLADTFTEAEKRRLVDRLGYDPTDAAGRFVYVVHATDREEFILRLSAWHERTKGQDTALLIYAHMGEADIGPVEDEDAPGVTWRELGDILGNAVSSLWLAGCESQHCLAAWAEAPSMHPVKNWVVCTKSSVYWQPLIAHFVKELSVAPLYMPDDIARDLEHAFPGQVRLLQREDRWVDLAT